MYFEILFIVCHPIRMIYSFELPCHSYLQNIFKKTKSLVSAILTLKMRCKDTLAPFLN